MDVIRRNTDYALRAMANLAGRHGDAPVSAATIADEEDISYQLVAKLLQRLQKARLVESRLGVKGGFHLSREPKQITLLDVVEAIQGPVHLSRCLVGVKACNRKACPIKAKLGRLQAQLTEVLDQTTLDQILNGDHGKG